MTNLGRGFDKVKPLTPPTAKKPSWENVDEIELGEGEDITNTQLRKYTTIIYTDGACVAPKRGGGWAFVVRKAESPEHAKTIKSGGKVSTTNNEMELTAILEAVLFAKSIGSTQTLICTDSQYCIKAIKYWSRGWSKRGWVTYEKTPVKNKELMVELYAQCIKIDFHWVRGHNHIEYNERADSKAQEMSTFFEYEL